MQNRRFPVARAIFGKVTLLYGLIGFAVSLLVLMLAPLLAGDAVSPTSLMFWQAVGIAIVIALILSWLFRADGVPERSPGSSERSDQVNQSEVDPLTHVLNQRGLTVKLLELMALGERYGNNLAVAVISIDHLQEVEEKYNQSVTDKALVVIADELGDTLRMPDRLGRWDEDQFIALLPETPLEGARHIGERLREAVSRAQFDGKRGVALTLTASIGVTIFRLGDDLQSLLSRATRAMNVARSQGSNQVRTDLTA